MLSKSVMSNHHTPGAPWSRESTSWELPLNAVCLGLVVREHQARLRSAGPGTAGFLSQICSWLGKLVAGRHTRKAFKSPLTYIDFTGT